MLALSVAALTVQHEGKCEVNYGLRVVYRESHCCLLDAVPDVPPVCSDSYLAAAMLGAVPDVPPVCNDSYPAAPMLDAVPDVPPVCSDSYPAAPMLDAVPDVPPVCNDSYLAAHRRLLNFQCILWDISKFRTAN
jgi:hypothetical protein